MTSKLTKLISTLIKEKKRERKNAKFWRDMYHGTIPKDRIHVKIKDQMRLVNELRELRNIKKALDEAIIEGLPHNSFGAPCCEGTNDDLTNTLKEIRKGKYERVYK